GEGREVSLTPKAYEILVCLLHHAGHILEKDTLMQEVWPDTFVEEGNLKVNISTLRKALGDTTEQPAFIETIPRRGYRFVAQVRAMDAVPSHLVAAGPNQVTFERRKFERTVTEEEEIIEAPGNGALTAAVRWPRRRWKWLVAPGIASALLIAVVGIFVYRALRPGEPVRVTLSGRKLQAWDAKERLAWEYEFSEPMEIATMAERE